MKKAGSEVESLADLARIAGVSVATVSRALANKPRIALATRTRIQALASETGYSVNPAASRLRTRQTRTIGLVLPPGHAKGQHASTPFFAAMLLLLSYDVAQRDHDLLLMRAETDRDDWLDRIVESRKVDGVIVVGQSDQSQTYDRVGRDYGPLVVWGQYEPDQHYLTVGIDNVAGGRLAGTHLLSRDRRKLLFVGAIDVPEFRARYEGFVTALPTEQKAAHRLLPVRHASQDGYTAMLDHFRAHPDTDGVFAGSDALAVDVVRAAVACGRSVPRDLSVVGFDDIALAAQSNPALTTVRQDLEAGSSSLCERLFRRMAGENCSSMLLPPRLIVRGSS